MQNRGFSLLELMVTLAVGAVILAIAIPSFDSIMASSRMTATNNSLVYSLQTARSEAIERLSSVGLCVSNTPVADGATCDGGAGYESGWIVYVDDNDNRMRDAAEEIVHRVDAPGPAFTFAPTAPFTDQIYFNDSGYSVNAANIGLTGTIRIVYGDGSLQQRDLTVSANGRVSTVIP